MPRPEPAPPEVDRFLPLGEVEWEILLALADGPKHGWAVLLDVEARAGAPRLLPGSLYRALHRLERDRLIAEAAGAAPGAAERRRVFALTALGRRVAVAEAARLAAALRAARRRGLVAEGEGA